MADFAERLRLLRNQKGISQQELADYLDVNKQTISGYERGVRRPAGENSLEIYEKLADYFNVDTSFLMGLSDVTVTLSNPLEKAVPDSIKARIDKIYSQLNAEGREKLLSYAIDLNESGRYKESEGNEGIG